ncbi:MAG: MBL fold metallo-hydrolase [Syntrophobacterales bacterium]|nr:MBL fold metallo-hydrolase [Syntrophobacterales bacterium]
MRVHFWGTRGSLPTALNAAQVRGKIIGALKAARGRTLIDEEEIAAFVDRELPFAIRGTYGGNSSCIEIRGGNGHVLCDAGTGLRDFGQTVNTSPGVYHLFLSHLHWDHLQGFPFFTPAYIPGNHVRIYSFHPDMEGAFTTQQRPPFFPVPLAAMRAEISFHPLEEGETYEIAGFQVRGTKQHHPGDSYGYRFAKDGKSVVYSTDSEHKKDAENPHYPYLDFIRETDLLIFDAQYTLLDAISDKENWGHSSNVVAVEMAVEGRVKRLCLFHHEHTYDDAMFDELLEDTRTYLRIHAETSRLEILLAYDGLEIEI